MTRRGSSRSTNPVFLFIRLLFLFGNHKFLHAMLMTASIRVFLCSGKDPSCVCIQTGRRPERSKLHEIVTLKCLFSVFKSSDARTHIFFGFGLLIIQLVIAETGFYDCFKRSSGPYKMKSDSSGTMRFRNIRHSPIPGLMRFALGPRLPSC